MRFNLAALFIHFLEVGLKLALFSAQLLLHLFIVLLEAFAFLLENFEICGNVAGYVYVKSGCHLGLRFPDQLTDATVYVCVILESVLFINLIEEFLFNVVKISENISNILMHIILHFLLYRHL